MSCRHCRPKKKKELTREQQVEAYRKQANYSRAIGVLWKRIAKDWEQKAEELSKPIK